MRAHVSLEFSNNHFYLKNWLAVVELLMMIGSATLTLLFVFYELPFVILYICRHM